MQSAKKFKTGATLRKEARATRFSGQTAGQAPNFLQGNVVILSRDHAQDFLLYCANNTKPCALIGITRHGED